MREILDVELGILGDENILITVTDDEDSIFKEDIFSLKIIKDHPQFFAYIRKSKRFGKIWYSR